MEQKEREFYREPAMRTETTRKLPPFFTQVIGSLPRPKMVRGLHARRHQMSEERFRKVMDCSNMVPLGGYGALHLFEELAQGITGTMPGCSLPGLYHDLWQLHSSGRQAECWELFTRALPLLSFQLGSLDLYVTVQKTLLTRIGVLSSARLRRPGVTMTPGQIEWLDFLMERTGMDSYLGACPQR